MDYDGEFESGLDHLREENNVDPETQEELKEYFESEEPEEKETDADATTTEEETEAEPFGGFEAPKEENEEPAADPLIEEMKSMTPESYQELMKENPAKALEMMVTHVMEKRGGMRFDPQKLMETSQTFATVQESRKFISKHFEPHKNPKLKEKAMEIYTSRGFDVTKHPKAEIDAFMIAAQENPDLLNAESGDVKNEPTTTINRRRRPEANTTKLTKSDREIADRMGIDLNDPKAVRRLAALKADYNRRRR